MFILFYKRGIWWKHLKGQWSHRNGCRLLSWGEGIETSYSTNSSWRPLSFLYFHLLLLLFWFTGFWLQLVLVFWCHSCFVCSGLTYEIYRGDYPSSYVYCAVCYRLTAVPCVRSVGGVFAHFYILIDDPLCFYQFYILYVFYIYYTYFNYLTVQCYKKSEIIAPIVVG